MFGTVTQRPPLQSLFYIPSNPSPLSPRHANLPSRRDGPWLHTKAAMSEAGGKLSSPPLSSSLSPSSFAQRYSTKISNPAARIALGVSREKRRDAFLDRLKQDREENKLKARSDQMLRMDCVAWRKRQEAMARLAPDLGLIDDEHEDGRDRSMEERESRDRSPPYLEGDLDALEQFISEENEFQALMDELAKEEDAGQSAQHAEESLYGDEDYESLFIDLLSHGGDQSETNQSMDTSHG